MFRNGATVFALVAAAAATLVGQTASAQQILDPSLPVYRPVDKLSGTLTLVGSDTMSHVAATWADSFRRFYPDVEVDIQVRGSINAVPSVIAGEASFGLLSRRITEAEVTEFGKKFGHPPTLLTPTLEPIAVYVHKDNPIESLSLQQIDAIFSSTVQRGAAKPAKTWGDVGVTGPWASKPITTVGRTDTTGSQVFFKESVLLGGEFRADLVQQKSNLDLVKSVAGDPQAVGFAGVTYVLPGVKPVPVTIGEGQPAYSPLSIEGIAGQYALVRPLQLVVNHPPQSDLTPLQSEFIKYVFSRMGQEDVLKSGFRPITGRPAQIALEAVGLETLN
ncbi:PBP superfamily domain protein [Maioricimonas rarisocia]|uniref:PBP superfamily domain protein n=1 Tax=Maioricimonas rarisocia TaxID=2528026 RepID=A0A517ZCW1_9PLAN|nr:PstS family phosphate ABC transporter substrate-binding protein [Maioricimonas rarisocia]QDU40299.1 PBP superfamily domain protein [Maioricimonas rarisocia]